jgi:hypothetical protein
MGRVAKSICCESWRLCLGGSVALAVASYAGQRSVLPTIAAPQSIAGQPGAGASASGYWIPLVLIAAAAISACTARYRHRLLTSKAAFTVSQTGHERAIRAPGGRGVPVAQLEGRGVLAAAHQTAESSLCYIESHKTVVQCKCRKTIRVAVVLVREFFRIRPSFPPMTGSKRRR